MVGDLKKPKSLQELYDELNGGFCPKCHGTLIEDTIHDVQTKFKFNSVEWIVDSMSMDRDDYILFTCSHCKFMKEFNAN